MSTYILYIVNPKRKSAYLDFSKYIINSVIDRVSTDEAVKVKSENKIDKYDIVFYHDVSPREDIFMSSKITMYMGNPYLISYDDFPYFKKINYILVQNTDHLNLLKGMGIPAKKLYNVMYFGTYKKITEKYYNTHIAYDYPYQNTLKLINIYDSELPLIIFSQNEQVLRYIESKGEDISNTLILKNKIPVIRGWKYNNIYLIVSMKKQLKQLLTYSKYEISTSSFNRFYGMWTRENCFVINVKGKEVNIEEIITDGLRGSNMKGYIITEGDIKKSLSKLPTININKFLETSLYENSVWDSIFYNLMNKIMQRVILNKKKEENPETPEMKEVQFNVREGLKCNSKQLAMHDENKFTPTEHQKRTVAYFLASEYRGMLLYHALGRGKTCESIMIINELYKYYDHVYICLPAALIDNFLNDYCSMCGDIQSDALKKFRFISIDYTGNIKYDKIPKHMNNSIIVIDELQKLIRGKDNKSETKVKLYDAINRSINSRIVALSATPVYTSKYELYYISDLLSGSERFPKNKDRFNDFLNNVEQSVEALRGIISYVGQDDTSNVPETIYMRMQNIEMSMFQYDVYKRARTRDKRAALNKRYHGNDEYMDKYRHSANVCIFAYPEDIIDIDKKEEVKNISYEWLKGIHIGKMLKRHSPKLYEILSNLKYEGKHIIFTNRVKLYGVYLISEFLRRCKVSHIIYTGETKDTRTVELNEFNNIDNKNGDIIKVMLISEAGIQGISTKGVRHVHIVNPQINENDVIQLIGRATRFNSHNQLPLEKRNVRVWRYHSILPKDEFLNAGTVIQPKREAESADELVYNYAQTRMKGLEYCNHLLQISSIDCEYSDAKKDCYEENSVRMNNEEIREIYERPYVKKTEHRKKAKSVFTGEKPYTEALNLNAPRISNINVVWQIDDSIKKYIRSILF